MTIKEIAILAGVSTSTVSKVACKWHKGKDMVSCCLKEKMTWIWNGNISPFLQESG